jgi:phosphoribosylaminoimidazole carboxylase (NCAIR synthetase)
MRALILVAGVAAALSGCSTLGGLSTRQKVDLGCEFAVLAAQTTGTVAQVAQEHGADPAKAEKLARDAATGADVVTAICTVANAVTPGL